MTREAPRDGVNPSSVPRRWSPPGRTGVRSKQRELLPFDRFVCETAGEARRDRVNPSSVPSRYEPALPHGVRSRKKKRFFPSIGSSVK
jgi:hypothetical protein